MDSKMHTKKEKYRFYDKLGTSDYRNSLDYERRYENYSYMTGVYNQYKIEVGQIWIKQKYFDDQETVFRREVRSITRVVQLDNNNTNRVEIYYYDSWADGCCSPETLRGGWALSNEDQKKVDDWHHQQYIKKQKPCIYVPQKKRRFIKSYEAQSLSSKLSHELYSIVNRKYNTKNLEILDYIGCSVEFLIGHLNCTLKKNWNKSNLHIDHIIPRSIFNHELDPNGTPLFTKEIRKCWNWRNLRYLPASENISKGNVLDMALVEKYGISDLLPIDFYCPASLKLEKKYGLG